MRDASKSAAASAQECGSISGQSVAHNLEWPQGVARENMEDLKPFIDGALPTRSHPQGAIDGPREWLAFSAVLSQALERTRWQLQRKKELEQLRCFDWLEPGHAVEALDWFAHHVGKEPPDPIEERQALRMTARTLIVMSSGKFSHGVKHYMHWLVTRAEPQTMVEAAQLVLNGKEWENNLFDGDVRDHAIWALRSAIVKTGEDYYESVLAIGQKTCAQRPSSDHRLMMNMAFILADDRPGKHPLQPLAVIEAMQAHGAIDQIDTMGLRDQSMLKHLIVQSPPENVQRLRSSFEYKSYSNYYYFYTNPLHVLQEAETALVTALHYGQSAAPTLKWLLPVGPSPLAPLILALEEREAFSLLTPYLHIRKVQAQLEKFAAKHPEKLFRKILQAVMDGSQDARLLGRLNETIRGRSYEELASWVGADSSALSFIDRQKSASGQARAAPGDAPAFLVDPPWLGKNKRPSIPALTLEPIPTPFAYAPERLHFGDSDRYEQEYCPPIDEVIEAVLHYVHTERVTFSLFDIEPGFEAREVKEFNSCIKLTVIDFRKERKIFDALFDGPHPEEGALTVLLWSDGPGGWYLRRVRAELFLAAMERFGQGAMPAFMKLFAFGSIQAFDMIEGFDYSAIAPHAARALFKLKKARERAKGWLARYRRTAVLRLIPDAVGAAGAEREAAINALRWIAKQTEGGRECITSLAQNYAKDEPRVLQALGLLLDGDPLDNFPSKIPKLPNWCNASAMSRPELLSRGAFPDEAMANLAQMLAFSAHDAPYAGIEQVRRVATPQSLAAFSWDLFSAWLAHGSPPKDIWAMRALGWLGDDECARKLAPLIRKWPGEKANARAVAGLDVLSDIGSEVALMLLVSIAEKVKFRRLQDKAKERIERIAQTRGLSAQELSDRMVPDLDLDEQGGLDLNFGARRFRVGFDQFLKPLIKDATGQRLNNLPKPNKSDDPELARKEAERFKALKHDAKAIAGLQITRLENMLVEQRRVAPEVFWARFASHPLVRHLACRLLWGAYPDDDPRSPPVSAFRVTEELSLADQNDDPIAMDFGATAQGRIGLVHPMNPPVGGLEGWSHLFADYEIAPPFLQLARERFALTEDEKGSASIKRFVDIEVDDKRLRSLVAYGWRLGDTQDGGYVKRFERPVQAGGKRLIAELDLPFGRLNTGALEDETTLGEITLKFTGGGGASSYSFGELDRVTASEILRGPTLLITKSGKQ